MKENRLFTLLSFILFTISATAQIKGIVRDSITKEPIAYAAIVYENTEIGTNTNEKGEFELTKHESNFIINVSCLGYKTKALQISNSNDIYLSQKQEVIQEVIISNRKNSSEITVGKYKNSRVSFGSTKPGIIYAKYINFNNEIEKHPFIKKIQFTTRSMVKNAKLKLRFLSVNQNKEIVGDVIFDEIIVIVKSGKHNNILDLEKYNIIIPKEGIFIGFEILIIEENKYEYFHTKQGEAEKQKQISYEPSIMVYEAKEINAWIIENYKSRTLLPETFSYFKRPEIGLKLTLTN
jgi:hypothetical protein